MRVMCLGDSNTYGFDPRSYFGGQYPPEARWVDLLAQRSGWEVLNEGENGRSIPQWSFELEMLQRTTIDESIDLLIVMLGSNDLLQGGRCCPDSQTDGSLSLLASRSPVQSLAGCPAAHAARCMGV